MTDPHRHAGPDDDPPPGVPRWVTVAAIVVGAVVLVLVVLQLTGAAGEHGPGRHAFRT